MNRLYFGDNLEIMREMEAGHIDLICTDPPFNSGRNYTAFFPESKAQEKAFEDIWKWDNEAIEARGDIRERADADDTYEALNMCLEGYDLVLQKSVSGNKGAMRAYLAFMGPRLAEMHRLLKNSGSIYLHCDPTASHYLKIVMDSLFGEKNFRNEIVWKRRADTHNLSTKHMGRNHDLVFFYVKSPKSLYRVQYTEYDSEYIQSHYKHEDTKGLYRLLPCTNEIGGNKPYSFRGITRAWRFSQANMNKMYDSNLLVQLRNGGPYYYKKYLSEAKGVPLQSIWNDIPPVRGAKEKTGYPTQKPLALLDRIIKASSNEGDLVLDPFLGSGTTAVAAKRLNRSCIGIEINADCIEIAEQRIKENV